jgi:hypothetical protein
MVFQAMPLFLSLRNQIAPILRNPLAIVRAARNKEAEADAPLLEKKESELAQLQREIDSLKLVIPLLVEDSLEFSMVKDISPEANQRKGLL